jgi:hypothetical protein
VSKHSLPSGVSFDYDAPKKCNYQSSVRPGPLPRWSHPVRLICGLPHVYLLKIKLPYSKRGHQKTPGRPCLKQLLLESDIEDNYSIELLEIYFLIIKNIIFLTLSPAAPENWYAYNTS